MLPFTKSANGRLCGLEMFNLMRLVFFYFFYLKKKKKHDRLNTDTPLIRTLSVAPSVFGLTACDSNYINAVS